MRKIITLLFSVLCLTSAPLAVLRAVDASKPATRPNILWFVVDDMSAHLSCYGETLIQTPHVGRLAGEGTRSANAFVTAPLCSPCRSALITGMYQTTRATPARSASTSGSRSRTSTTWTR